MENIDLILLVIADTKEKYYIEYIEYYWKPFIKYIKNNKIDIKIFLLFGENPNIYINPDDIIISNTPENFIPGILQKTFYSFKYVNNRYNYKHILRTNISSFFILDKLVDISNKLGSENIYTGCGKKRFHCGCGIWFSRDIIDYLLNKKNNIIWELPDDYAIWKLLKNKPMSKLSRYDIYPSTMPSFMNNLELLIDIIDKENHYHIRIKTNDRYQDTKLINKLTNYYYK